MKRKSLIAVLALVIVMASTAISFAGTGLSIVSSFPEDGQKNTSMENLGVKIVFNNPVNDDANQKSNMKAVKLTDEKGKNVPIKVLFGGDDGKMMLAVADLGDGEYKVLNNSDYKLTIGADFVDNDGNQLGKDVVITFKTYNQKVNNIVNMGIMILMFGGIMVFSMKQNNDKKEEEEVEKGEAFNPYKEAKRTGKSIEEVMAEREKELAKVAKKKARKKNDEPAYEKHIENCAELLNNVYHVHAPAPVNKADRSIEALNRMRKAEKAAAKAEQAAKAAKRKKKK